MISVFFFLSWKSEKMLKRETQERLMKLVCGKKRLSKICDEVVKRRSLNSQKPPLWFGRRHFWSVLKLDLRHPRELIICNVPSGLGCHHLQGMLTLLAWQLNPIRSTRTSLMTRPYDEEKFGWGKFFSIVPSFFLPADFSQQPTNFKVGNFRWKRGLWDFWRHSQNCKFYSNKDDLKFFV